MQMTLAAKILDQQQMTAAKEAQSSKRSSERNYDI
jgi:hypothetical protein